MPEISVLMSAFNAEKYIEEAITSVLGQTFTDFEFIIINDGSTDNTEAIITKFSDNRIKYYSQDNQGVSKSLNRGLKIACGKYIAKLDADDICYNERFKKQFEFMEENPSYVVCGSFTDVIDENGEFIYKFTTIPTINEDIQLEMENRNCIVHSSSFYRRDYALLVGGYYEPIKHYFEDYMFFYNLIKKGKAYNFTESLIKYRVTPGSISSRDKNKKYETLVRNVIHRGHITEKEKVFLFSYRSKKAKKNVQLSNHYLALARLILIYQGNINKSMNFYYKAFKNNPININLLLSGVYMFIVFLMKKLK